MSNLFDPVSHPMLETAALAARRGGALLKASFRTQVAVQAKSKANFVSEVDIASEKAVVETIRHAFPEHAVIAEEGHRESATAEHLWIVDPLDGTSNYLHGLPQFAVSIAYVQRGEAQLGIVYNPVTEDWFYGVRGQGAWNNGKRMTVNREASLDESLIAVGFYYDRGRLMEATLAAIKDLFGKQIHGIRRFGAAALDLAQLARGDYGAYFEYQLSPWDHAAGGLMLHEAGGRLTDCRNQRLPWDRSSSVLASNGLLHDAMLRIVEPHYESIFATPHSS